MGDYLALDPASRRDLLLTASAELGRDPAVLEKDIRVVQTLGWLFDGPYEGQLVFKGGTSLSKVHRLIDRFSEDIDLTYDIRQLVPEWHQAEADPLPATRSKADRWTTQARSALERWVAEVVVPGLHALVDDRGASVRADGADLYVEYHSALDASEGYLRPGVKVEFGGRATGELAAPTHVTCDAASCAAVAGELPTARVRAISSARTFWEKATAAHVFCLQEKLPAERFARHWFDLACMHRAGVVDIALSDRSLAEAVAGHKAMFFRMKGGDGGVVDYLAAVHGNLRLIPSPDATRRLHQDYEAMRSGGFLGRWRPSFDEVLDLCRDIQTRANASVPGHQRPPSDRL